MARRVLVPSEVQQRIVEAYRRGESSVARIASDVGYSENKVYSVLREHGVIGKRSWHPGRKFSPDQEAEMARLYEAGHSLTQVARQFGCQYETVYKILLRLGVEMRKRGGRGLQFSDEEVGRMAELWASGRSQAEIGQEFGVGQVVISRVLRYRVSGNKLIASRRAVRERHGHWKGGRIVTSDGYVRVLVDPDDLLAMTMKDAQGYVLEHRLVMARHLGRALFPWETVHHIDSSDRTDNRIGNLQLRIGRHGKHAAFRCRACGSIDLEAVELDDSLIRAY